MSLEKYRNLLTKPYANSELCRGEYQRDRQRERQRQERAQMLPSDDKELTANTQDLFESPPVKVDRVGEDHTAAEIRKQFGNFESVRPYILDNPRYSHRLIGVDQGAAANANRPGSASGSHAAVGGTKPSSSISAQSLPHRPSANPANSRPAAVPGKNHAQPHPSLGPAAHGPQPETPAAPLPPPAKPAIGGFKSTFVPVPTKPVDSGNSHKSPQVPPQAQHHSALAPSSGSAQPTEQANQSIKTQPKPPNNAFKSSGSASIGNQSNSHNNNHNSNSGGHSSGSAQIRSGSVPLSHTYPPPSHHSAARSSTSFPPPNPVGVRKPNSHAGHSSSSSSTISFNNQPSHVTTNSSSQSGGNRSSIGSVSGADNSAHPHKGVVPAKAEHFPPPQTAASLFKTEESSSNSQPARPTAASSDGNKPKPTELNANANVNDGVDKKPTLDLAVDSPIELDTILKEMMDVKTPVTGIQTPGPANETASTKTPQRRSSKGEDIVQSITDSGIANVPSPVKKMDSSGDSSSSSSGSDSSDSDDSSSGSDGEDQNDTSGKQTTNSPTRNSWDLGSFLKGDRDKAQESFLDSTVSPAPVSPLVSVKTEPSVSSTSLFGKPVAPAPKDIIGTAQSKSPRKAAEVRTDVYLPAKPPPATASPAKGAGAIATTAIKKKGTSLSESSSEDESPVVVEKKPAKETPTRVKAPEPKRAAAPVNKRQKSLSSSPERKPSTAARSGDAKGKAAKKGQDRNKNDTIRKLFSNKNASSKLNSPSPVETEKPTKAKAPVSSAGKGKVPPPTKGKGKPTPSPKAASPVVNNRVSGKDSAKKGGAKPTAPLLSAPNGTVNVDPTKTKAKTSTATTKRKEPPKKAPPQPPPPKVAKTSQKTSAGSGSNLSAMLPPLPPARAKEDLKPNVAHLSSSSLICRIPFHKLPKRARLSGSAHQSSTSSLISAVSVKTEKVDKGSTSTSLSSKDDATGKGKPHHGSTRVGSSSDHPTSMEIDIFGLAGLPDKNPKKPAKRSKRITSSQKKGKGKPDPVSKIKVESEYGTTEVSSNVPGYSPPVDSEIVQAPDSSLHPSSHLQSPIVLSQPAYMSYFDKIEHPDEEEILDQDTYLEVAKKLKHKADKEECGSFKQVFTYLESGLYFILTGIAIEKERASPSKEAHTMYKDTLHLIRYIGNRFRSRPDCSSESKVMVLGLRCQALLSLKLFKMKFKEAKDIMEVLYSHFQKTPPTPLELANSPQLSTPSPRSPTTSPASSLLTGGLNPSPHHPYQNHPHLLLSQNLHAQMYKHCTHSMNLMNAHEFWEAGDTLVQKSHIEEFFIAIDRRCGPLTLHSTLNDLVRYVRHGVKVLKDNAEIS